MKSILVILISVVFIGCCQPCTGGTISGIYDWKVICDGKKTCSIDSPEYVNLIKYREEPIKVDVTRGEHLEYLGRSFDRGIVHRNYMSDCRIEISNNDYYQRQIKEIDLTFTNTSIREIKFSLEIIIDKLIEKLVKFSKDGNKNKLAIQLRKAIEGTMNGKARYSITIYSLNSSAISRFSKQCGKQFGVVELAVVQLDFAALKLNIINNFLLGIQGEIDVAPVSGEIKAILQDSLETSIGTTFNKQSFLAAAGWARRK